MRYGRAVLALAVAAGVGAGVVACGGGGGGGGGGTPTEPDEGVVQGRVTDEANSGVAGANLTLRAAGGGTESESSDGSGAYRFEDVAVGTYTLSIAVPTGFTLAAGQSAERQVTVTAGGTQTVDYRLQSEGGGEFTVVELTAGLAFSPREVRIAVGERVRWVNRSAMLHTVTPDGHTEWSEATLDENGETFEHVFDEAGTFEYICVPHEGSGMTGTVVVE